MAIICVVCGVAMKSTSMDMRPHQDPWMNMTPRQNHWLNPCLVLARPEYLEWQKLSPKEQSDFEDDEKLIQVIRASNIEYNDEGTHLLVRYSGGIEEGPRFLPTDASNPVIPIPIHHDCLQVTKLFCSWQKRFDLNFRAPNGGHPSRLVHFYEIWSNRARATLSHGSLRRGIKENHKYYLGKKTRQLFQITDQTIETSPLGPVPSLARVILNRLRLMPEHVDGPDSGTDEVFLRMMGSPQEIFDLIIKQFQPLTSPPLKCNRVMPNSWWKEQLLKGRLIPWLWDIDAWDEPGKKFDPFGEDDSGYRYSMWKREFGFAHVEQPLPSKLGDNRDMLVTPTIPHAGALPSMQQDNWTPLLTFGNLSAAFQGPPPRPSRFPPPPLPGVPYSGITVHTITAQDDSGDEEILTEIIGRVKGGGRSRLRQGIRDIYQSRKVMTQHLRPQTVAQPESSGVSRPRAQLPREPVDDTNWVAKDWDWELLARQLAQEDVLVPGKGILGDAPPPVRRKLWNRKRIWDLLDSARLGHICWEIPDPAPADE
ncbi:hypothetical protein SCUP234_09274 [Seiridium cupressi]